MEAVQIELWQILVVFACLFIGLIAMCVILIGAFALGAYVVFRTKTGELDIPFLGAAKAPVDGGVGHYSSLATGEEEDEGGPEEAQLENVVNRIRMQKAAGTFDLDAFKDEVTGGKPS